MARRSFVRSLARFTKTKSICCLFVVFFDMSFVINLSKSTTWHVYVVRLLRVTLHNSPARRQLAHTDASPTVAWKCARFRMLAILMHVVSHSVQNDNNEYRVNVSVNHIRIRLLHCALSTVNATNSDSWFYGRNRAHTHTEHMWKILWCNANECIFIFFHFLLMQWKQIAKQMLSSVWSFMTHAKHRWTLCEPKWEAKCMHIVV